VRKKIDSPVANIHLPKLCVVDTNVPIAANGKATCTTACRLSCIDALDQITKSLRIVMDSKDEIFDEYRRHWSRSGEPDVGDMFFKWVNDNRHNEARCIRVEITGSDDERVYEQFPKAAALKAFDRSDRKFVAVAVGCPEKAAVLNATDTDWHHHHDALTECGVRIHYLCPDAMKRASPG